MLYSLFDILRFLRREPKKIRKFIIIELKILQKIVCGYLLFLTFLVSIFHLKFLLTSVFYFDFHNQFPDFATHWLVLVMVIVLDRLLICQYNIGDGYITYVTTQMEG